MRLILIIPLLWAFMINAAFAGQADVLKVDVKGTGPNTYRFSVTVRHNDQGWDHYADKWDVVAPDGTILATRILHHPHDKEQPFTRSLGGIKIPSGIQKVFIQAHDSVHGYGGKTISIELSR